MIFVMADERAASETRWQFGSHSMWVAAPDVLRLDLDGEVNCEQLQNILDTQEAWGRDLARWFSIVNMSQFGKSTAESRAYMAKRTPNPRVTSIAFGASFAMRTVVEMMMRARRLLYREVNEKFFMVATEAEAWARVDDFRKRRG
jgi:hypothetical protein